MAWASWTFWWFCGRPTEGRSWVEEALEKEPHLPAPARAKLLFFRRMGDEGGIAHALATAGFVALGQERRDEGLALLEESADLGLKLGQKWVSSACSGFAAMGALDGRDTARTQRLAERGLSLAREVNAKDAIYVTLHALATVAWAEDDRERGAALRGGPASLGRGRRSDQRRLLS